MTPLRAKFQRDMAVRGLAQRTQQSYISYVADLARHYDRSPDLITYEEVVDWIHHLIEDRHLAPSTINIAVKMRIMLAPGDPSRLILSPK